jgi:hypothetical protein
MNWILTIRAIAILLFVAAFVALCAAGNEVDNHHPQMAWLGVGVSATLALSGCILVGVGWGRS